MVAHADDSILFLNPDEQHDIARGDPVRAVFVTAGESALGVTDPYWTDREAGALAAFAHMAGMADTWSTGTLMANGHALVLNTLTGNPNVSVVFMRLPDGNTNGTGFPDSNHESLQSLWASKIPAVHAIDGSTSYTREDLIATLTSIMVAFQPGTVRTQDFVGTFGGGDHSDHYATAYFTQAANLGYTTTAHKLVGYLGYPVTAQPANVSGRTLHLKIDTYLVYAPHDALAPQTLAKVEAGPYGQWCARQYTVATLSTARRT